MNIKFGNNEFDIEFAYKPTLKERIISKFVAFGDVSTDDGEMDFEKLEDLLLFIPEVILVGLQKNYKDYHYNYDTKEGREEQLEKAFELMEEYTSRKDSDITELFEKLKEALLEDGFLRGLFQKEQEKQEEEANLTTEATGQSEN